MKWRWKSISTDTRHEPLWCNEFTLTLNGRRILHFTGTIREVGYERNDRRELSPKNRLLSAMYITCQPTPECVPVFEHHPFALGVLVVCLQWEWQWKRAIASTAHRSNTNIKNAFIRRLRMQLCGKRKPLSLSFTHIQQQQIIRSDTFKLIGHSLVFVEPKWCCKYAAQQRRHLALSLSLSTLHLSPL